MEAEEKQLRMQRMRKSIREHNVFHWAGTLIEELCDLRLDAAPRNIAKAAAPVAC
jgi:trehalose 6-phosphate synthase